MCAQLLLDAGADKDSLDSSRQTFAKVMCSQCVPNVGTHSAQPYH
jgi:hypothetical protein